MDRAPGLSVRLKLTLSYAGFLTLAGVLMLAAAWLRAGRGSSDSCELRARRRDRHAGRPGAREPLLPPARVRPGRGHRAGVPAGVRSRRGLDPGRPDARPAASHHGRDPYGGERVALAPDPAARPQGRVPRARRRLRRHARPARDTGRRAAAVRGQRLPRAAYAARDHADAPRRGPQGPEPWRRRARRPTPRSSTPGRSTSPRRCCCSAARTSGPSSRRPSTCPSSRRRRPRRSCRSRRSAASPSRPPERSRSPRGSRALLLQLTTNLVHNAIVHNLPDHGTVCVTTRVHPKTVVLTVENTGDQLSPRLVATLGEPFQRGTERIHTDHAGVGLGLAIVKSIAEGTRRTTHAGSPARRRAPGHGAAACRAEPPLTHLRVTASGRAPCRRPPVRRCRRRGRG